MGLSALLPALAFFGSVAYATSGPSSGSGTSKVVKKTVEGFVDKPKTNTQKFFGGAKSYTKDALFGQGGALAQMSSTPVDLGRIKAPSVGGVQMAKAGQVNLYVPGSTNQRVMSKAQSAQTDPLIRTILGKAIQYNPRVGRNINLSPLKVADIKSRTNPKQVYS
jgi:hypothetical protein